MDTEMRSCEKHGEVSHFLGLGGWVCGPCIEDQGRSRRRQNVALEPPERAAERHTAAGIPPLYAEASLADFKGAWLLRALEWANAAPTERGCLVIEGPVGTGKTHLACALLKRCLMSGTTAKYTDHMRYLTAIRDTWGNYASEGKEKAVREAHILPRILVLDEVGAAGFGDGDATRIAQLINERYVSAKPTIIVTNLLLGNPQAGVPRERYLLAALGDRAYDRIKDQGVIISLTGESRRKPK